MSVVRFLHRGEADKIAKHTKKSFVKLQRTKTIRLVFWGFLQFQEFCTPSKDWFINLPWSFLSRIIWESFFSTTFCKRKTNKQRKRNLSDCDFFAKCQPVNNFPIIMYPDILQRRDGNRSFRLRSVRLRLIWQFACVGKNLMQAPWKAILWEKNPTVRNV